jgi:hypothetical protein
LNYIGTCDSAADAVSKIVSLDGDDAEIFKLINGVTLAVNFTKGNGYHPDNQYVRHLNVNNTGSKKIRYRTTDDAGKEIWREGLYQLSAGSSVFFIYKNEYWEVNDSGGYSRFKQTANSI